MSFMEKMGSIDRRVLYVLMAVSTAIPLLFPLGLPLSVSPMTQIAYDTIDKIQPGDVVVYAMDFSVGYKPDLWPGVIAIMDHLMQKKAKVIMLTVIEDGALLGDELCKMFQARGFKYGEDFVNLGYSPGGETAVSALAKNLHTTFPKDFYGKPTADLPLTSKVKDATAFKLVVAVATNITPGGLDWVKQVQGPFNVPTIFHSGTMLVPQFVPYLQSGQLKGMLKGIGGSAEYERLISKPGDATAGMEGQSLAHLVVLAFILVGNLAYIARRQKPAGTGGGVK